jgi:hypothetical protein
MIKDEDLPRLPGYFIPKHWEEAMLKYGRACIEQERARAGSIIESLKSKIPTHCERDAAFIAGWNGAIAAYEAKRRQILVKRTTK